MIQELESKIIRKVKEVRNAQNEYYRTPSNSAFKPDKLVAAKAHEAELDTMLREHNRLLKEAMLEKSQPKLDFH